ncbi:odorant receptor 4-like [Culex pipiens pallens]|uniref:odorant receptor 4-like n=1 Tax=Culex pipiens pallens TaxID=42434 RepID=UPI001954B5DE|nr:odorant receptor 4-like [Culex pipiens pallens]
MYVFEDTLSSLNLMFFASGIPPCNEFYPETIRMIFKENKFFLIAFSLLFYTQLGEIVYLAQMVQRECSFLELTFQAPCVGYCSIGLLKMVVIAVKRNVIAELVQNLRDVWDQSIITVEHREICKNVMKPAIFITSLTAVVNVIMGISFTILPIAEMIYHYALTGGWVRQLPFLICWPFDPLSGNKYFLVYQLYIVIGFSGIIIHMAFDCLFCILTAHICMNFRILEHDFENIKSASDINETSESITKCLIHVEKHQRLHKYKEAVDGIFSFTLCYNFFVSSIIICIQGFMITAASGYTLIKFALFLASFLVELFLLCFYGQDVSESSSQVAQAAYNCSWYNESKMFRQLILQIIMKAQRPLVLMAWKFWPVNIMTFSSILSASWSYFTLLRTVYYK